MKDKNNKLRKELKKVCELNKSTFEKLKKVTSITSEMRKKMKTKDKVEKELRKLEEDLKTAKIDLAVLMVEAENLGKKIK